MHAEISQINRLASKALLTITLIKLRQFTSGNPGDWQGENNYCERDRFLAYSVMY